MAIHQPHTYSRTKSKENMDRFIPNRSAMDFDYANYMLTDGRKERHNVSDLQSPSKVAYLKQLKLALNLNRTRILEFRDKPPSPPQDLSSFQLFEPVKPQRHIPLKSVRTLDAPGLLDDDSLNLLDLGSNNVVVVACGNTINLYDESTRTASELVTVDDDKGPVTSVNWSPDGLLLAVGLDNSEIQLWDSTTNSQVRVLRGSHAGRVGSLAWNKDILTTGSMDGRIVDNDVRSRDHIVNVYAGHDEEVCGLKWSPSGKHLASGGNDHLLHIWDRSMAYSNSANTWLHRLRDHKAKVKALSWCPFQDSLLASGGGVADHSIKFWNTNVGACINSVETGSQVSSLLWSSTDKELLSSHGLPENELILWSYPSMKKMAILNEHSSPVLSMAQSPDGCKVVSADADIVAELEKLKIWNMFAKPDKTIYEPFANCNRIYMR